jgi:hypothetical protein
MLNRRLTGGLAWGGLVLILAVPSAEMISARVEPLTAQVVSVTDPIQTASIAVTKDAVDALVAPVKKLPAVVASVSAPAKPIAPVAGVVMPQLAVAAVQPKAAVLEPVVVEPEAVETASLSAEPAPVPMPASMRPKSIDDAEAPLILDDATVASRDLILPVAEPEVVTEQQLQEWDSGSLADYLQRRGLVSDASFYNDPSRSSASYSSDSGLVPLADVSESDAYWNDPESGDSFLLWGN